MDEQGIFWYQLVLFELIELNHIFIQMVQLKITLGTNIQVISMQYVVLNVHCWVFFLLQP